MIVRFTQSSVPLRRRVTARRWGRLPAGARPVGPDQARLPASVARNAAGDGMARLLHRLRGRQVQILAGGRRVQGRLVGEGEALMMIGDGGGVTAIWVGAVTSVQF